MLLKPFNNVLRKPGPIFNYLSGVAWDDGCDFFYRINDDTVLMTEEMLGKDGNRGKLALVKEPNRWTSIFIEMLAAFKPPYVGVVGPIVHGSMENFRILTHDFVSRHHLEIFPWHYSPAFPDWYLDNWISRVYSDVNTQKTRLVAVAHSEGETRYKVSLRKKAAIKLLNREVKRGREMVKAFLAQRRIKANT